MTETATLTEARPFALGDRVTYTVDGRDYTGTVRGIYSYQGVGVDGATTNHPDASLFVVGSGYEYDYPVAEARSGGDRVFADDAQDDERGHWASIRNTAPRLAVEAPESPALSESAAQVTALEATVSALRDEVAATREAIRTIGSTLVETAEQHEWCGEYDRRATALVDSLPSRYGLDELFREAAVREHDFTVRFYGTYSVTASNADAAREVFNELDLGDLRYDLEIDYVESD